MGSALSVVTTAMRQPKPMHSSSVSRAPVRSLLANMAALSGVLLVACVYAQEEPEKATRATPTPTEALATVEHLPAAVASWSDSAKRQDILALFATDLQRRLGDSLRRGSQYPREALREGLEGTTRVGIRFAPAGVLEDVRVESSSGHALLDEAALRIVRGLSLPPVPRDLRESRFDLSLPITFRVARP